MRIETPDSGQMIFDGEDVFAKEPRRASLAYRGKVQVVFQDPFGSLDPRQTVGRIEVGRLGDFEQSLAHEGALFNSERP